MKFKILYLLLFFLAAIIFLPKFDNLTFACQCSCPNTQNSDGSISWGTPYCEPSNSCSVCPGASCSGSCGGGGGGGGGSGSGGNAQQGTVNISMTDTAPRSGDTVNVSVYATGGYAGGTKDCTLCDTNLIPQAGLSCQNPTLSGTTWTWACTAQNPSSGYVVSETNQIYNGSSCTGSLNSACSASINYSVKPPIPGSFFVNNPTSTCTGSSPYANISWYSSSNAAYYKVYRANYGWVSGNLSGNSFQDNNLTSGQNYQYYVYAFNNIDESAIGSTPSPVIGAVCDTTPPTVSITGFPPPGNSCLSQKTLSDPSAYAKAYATDLGNGPGGLRRLRN